MPAFFRRLLASPRFPAWLLLAVAVLSSPALRVGFVLDDHGMRLLFLHPEAFGREGAADPLGLFRFIRPEDPATALFRDLGTLPWWTAPELRLSFFRPLASLSHWLDHQVAPGAAWLMALHSIAWMAAAALAAWGAFRATLGTAGIAAALAAWMWALDDARAMPVGWISNRNALLAACFGFLALAAHARARAAGRVAAPAAWGAFALAMAAGESGAATGAWLLAHALFLDRGPARDRLRALVPYLVVGVAWFAAFVATGSGAAGSDFYLDPVGEPGRFLAALPGRGAALLGAQWLGPPADFWPLWSAPARAASIAAGALVALAVAALSAPLLARDAVARFFAFGMLLSLVPIAATTPHDRLLLFVGFGASGLLARLATTPGGPAGARPPGRAARAALALLLAWHVALGPLLLPARILSTLPVEGAVASLSAGLDALGDPRGRTLVVVQGAPFFLMNVLTRRATHGEPTPARFRLLADGARALVVERLDDRTLRLRRDGGWITPVGRSPEPDGTLAPLSMRHLLDTMNALFRSRTVPFARGEAVSLPGVRFVVEEVADDGQALAVRVAFDIPLDDPRLLWATADGWTLRPWAPPAPGATAFLPALTLPLP